MRRLILASLVFLSACTASDIPAPATTQTAIAPDPWTLTERDATLAERANALLDAFTNTEPALTPDGKRIVFVSNRDGLPQLYVADARRPRAPARRLLDWPERISQPRTSRDGKAAIFMSDKGADENWAFFRVDLDGGNVVALTPGEKMRRDPPFIVGGAPDTLFFSGRVQSEPGTAIYATSAVAAVPARLIHRFAKSAFLKDVSWDGKLALVQTFPSVADHELLLLDIESGTTRTLYPLRGKAAIPAARFSTDGRHALVATDGGGEQALLLLLDLASGKEVARYVETAPPTASLRHLSLSRRHERVAVVVAAGNRTEVRLLDARTLKPLVRVKLPLGSCYTPLFRNPGLEIAEDGSRIVLSWSTPDEPTDLFAVNARTGKLSRLRAEPRPSLSGVQPLDVSIANVTAHDGLTISLNVYLPKSAVGRKNPVIFYFHGGPALSYEVRWWAISRFFLDQGYVWVEPNLRGSTGFGRAYEKADDVQRRLDSFKDIEAAARWISKQPWADPQRLISSGQSYGGYVTLIALTRQPGIWRAGINLYGPPDIPKLLATTSGLGREISIQEFGDPKKDAAFLDSISPINDMDHIVDPLFVYAGANDPRVPLAENGRVVRALRERQVPVEYMVKDNEGHFLERKENQVEFLVRSARFLETHAR